MNNTTRQTAADLSHQIRNRLTYIMLSSHTLCCELEKALSEEQRTEFCKIDLAAGEIRSILDNLVGLLPTQAAELRSQENEATLLIGG